MRQIKNPIILLGGFLIPTEAYQNIKRTIEDVFDREIHILDITRKEWLKTNSIKGWGEIMNKIEAKTLNIFDKSKGKKIDFIGHSSGGMILRLYLSDEIINGKIYNGKLTAKNLITLGTPHQAIRATKLRKFVNQKYPGNFFKEINYVSIGGKVTINSDQTTFLTKFLGKRFYKSISGSINEEGDGLVPLSSSILKGSQAIIIPNTAHSSIFGRNWYGTTQNIKEWFNQISWR